MQPGISIHIVGDDSGVQRMLGVLDTALNPVGVAGFLGATVEPYLLQRAADRFATEGDDVVGAWAPLKPATQQIRADLGYGAAHPINRRTGELEDYITNGPGNISVHPWGAGLTLPGREATGDLKDKFQTAQQGATRTVPRPVLGMNERDLSFVLLALAQYIQQVGTRLTP